MWRFIHCGTDQSNWLIIVDELKTFSLLYFFTIRFGYSIWNSMRVHSVDDFLHIKIRFGPIPNFIKLLSIGNFPQKIVDSIYLYTYTSNSNYIDYYKRILRFFLISWSSTNSIEYYLRIYIFIASISICMILIQHTYVCGVESLKFHTMSSSFSIWFPWYALELESNLLDSFHFGMFFMDNHNHLNE